MLEIAIKFYFFSFNFGRVNNGNGAVESEILNRRFNFI